MDQSQVAKVYARALLELGQETKATEDFEAELKGFADGFQKDGEIWGFLISPRVPKQQKVQVLEKAYRGKASDAITSLLCILVRNDRIMYLPEISNQYRILNDKLKGLIRAKVYSASQLSNSDITQIKEWFRDAYKAACEVETFIQPELIGGVVLKYDDKVVDGSIRNKLKDARESIFSGMGEQLLRKQNTGAYYED